MDEFRGLDRSQKVIFSKSYQYGEGPPQRALPLADVLKGYVLKEATSKPVIRKQTDSLNLSWRDKRYHRFYAVVDRLVDELQEHVWIKTGKPKRRLKGDGLEKLHYSVEC